MENEENRGIIHKKAFEDQLATFCQFSFGALSLFFLSLTHSWKGKEGKRKQISSKERQDQAHTTGFLAGINLHVHFPCYIWNEWHCMWFFFITAWVFPSVTMFFSLALSFPDSHGVMGFSCFG